MEYAILLPYAVLTLGAVGTLWTLWQFRKGDRNLRRLLIGPMLLFFLYPSLVVTPPGHRGVIFSQAGGVLTGERAEGLSFVIPYFQSAAMINVQIRRFDYEVFAQTEDLQEVTVPVQINARVAPQGAAELYRDIGKDYERAVIEPAVLQLAKAEIGKIKAVDFAVSRAQLASDIQFQLTERLDQEGIIIEFVSVSDAVFDPDFIRAVKNKIIADEAASEQIRLIVKKEAEAAQAIATAEGVKQASILEAEGVAEANRLIDESLTPDILRWQALVRWTGTLPNTYIGGAELGELPALLIDPR